MLITLQDDQVVRVYDSVENVIGDVEALDAEEVLRAVFDETGEVYEIKWIKPNMRGRFFRSWIGNGEYTLVATGRKDVAGLLGLIRNSTYVEPAEARQDLAAVQSALSVRE